MYANGAELSQGVQLKKKKHEHGAEKSQYVSHQSKKHK